MTASGDQDTATTVHNANVVDDDHFDRLMKFRRRMMMFFRLGKFMKIKFLYIEQHHSSSLICVCTIWFFTFKNKTAHFDFIFVGVLFFFPELSINKIICQLENVDQIYVDTVYTLFVRACR